MKTSNVTSKIMKCPSVPRRAFLALFAIFAGAVSGCGDAAPKTPKTVAVSGTVTLDGREWPAPGSLFFRVVEPADGFPKKSGSAEFGKKGQFVAQTFVDGDGLIPGRYEVGVNCWAEPYKMGGPPQKSHVPKKYRDAGTSGLEAVVDTNASEGMSLNFDVPLD